MQSAAPMEYSIFVQNVTQPWPTVIDVNGNEVNTQRMSTGDHMGQAAPGVKISYQLWYRDGNGPCGNGSNLSSAVSLYWRP